MIEELKIPKNYNDWWKILAIQGIPEKSTKNASDHKEVGVFNIADTQGCKTVLTISKKCKTSSNDDTIKKMPLPTEYLILHIIEFHVFLIKIQ